MRGGGFGTNQSFDPCRILRQAIDVNLITGTSDRICENEEKYAYSAG